MALGAEDDVGEAQAAAAELDGERVAVLPAVGQNVLARRDHGQPRPGLAGQAGRHGVGHGGGDGRELGGRQGDAGHDLPAVARRVRQTRRQSAPPPHHPFLTSSTKRRAGEAAGSGAPRAVECSSIPAPRAPRAGAGPTGVGKGAL